jgi:integrase
MQLYLDHKIPHLKNGTKAAQDMAHLLPYITGKRLDALGAVAKKYVQENPHLAPATVKNRLAYLKAAVRYAYTDHDLGDRDYTDKMIMPKVNNKRHVYVTQDAFHHKLLAHCEDTETRALLTLAFYTGLRWRSEILTLKADQILVADGQPWISIPDSKNGTPHMIPVHPNASWALQFIPFQWGDSYYYQRFWAARRAAGMSHIRIHDERHSLASALLSTGATLGEVGNVLNHDSVQSTDRYSHLYPERVKKLILGLPIVAERSAPPSDTPEGYKS